ncbi:MAG: YkgJ family cysteine cluster protein [Dokdonella sp.]
MNTDFDSASERIDPTIRCADCEAVCCRLPVLLLPGDSVPIWAIDHDEHGLEIVAKADDGWCVALDRHTMRCTIYARRPQICAEFAMGGDGCRDEREAWFGKPGSSIPITVIGSS